MFVRSLLSEKDSMISLQPTYNPLGLQTLLAKTTECASSSGASHVFARPERCSIGRSPFPAARPRTFRLAIGGPNTSPGSLVHGWGVVSGGRYPAPLPILPEAQWWPGSPACTVPSLGQKSHLGCSGERVIEDCCRIDWSDTIPGHAHHRRSAAAEERRQDSLCNRRSARGREGSVWT